MIVDCKKCRASGHGRCQCPDDGVIRDGQTLRIAIRMADNAAATSSEAITMTDNERRTMRDGVQGMPLHQAAALPIYDGVRGSIVGGMPAPEYFALMDGAISLPHLAGLPPTAQNIADAGDKLGAQLAYERRISDAWRARPPETRQAASAQDDIHLPMVAADNGQAAYEARLKNAWQQG